MQLHLQFPPTPEFAARHAELAVEGARNIESVELDYSPASLAIVDHILAELHEQRAIPEIVSQAIFAFGCYTGEVMVRNNGAKWTKPDGTSLAGDLSPMFVQLPNGTLCNPIGKAFKLVQAGMPESLEYFYQVMTRQP
jgi:hypothetical protein